jgi:hypothetical protein
MPERPILLNFRWVVYPRRILIISTKDLVKKFQVAVQKIFGLLSAVAMIGIAVCTTIGA